MSPVNKFLAAVAEHDRRRPWYDQISGLYFLAIVFVTLAAALAGDHL